MFWGKRPQRQNKANREIRCKSSYIKGWKPNSANASHSLVSPFEIFFSFQKIKTTPSRWRKREDIPTFECDACLASGCPDCGYLNDEECDSGLGCFTEECMYDMVSILLFFVSNNMFDKIGKVAFADTTFCTV